MKARFEKTTHPQHRFGLIGLALFGAMLLMPLSSATAQSPPNILFIVMDDAGIENISFYNVRGPNPLTPYADTTAFLDDFAANWLTFDQAWSNPFCSPTRASFHTGEYAFRTGIGDVINSDLVKGLDVSDPNLLPKLMASSASGTTPYEVAMFGKWHLGTSVAQGNEDAPGQAGWEKSWSTLLDEQEAPPAEMDVPYFHFWETVDGSPTPDEFDADVGGQTPDLSIYLTAHFRDRAADWINEKDGSGKTWFAYVPFVAPHDPFHCPLTDIGSPYEGETFECDDLNPDKGKKYRSMIKTIDLELDRFLNETPANGGISWDPTDTLVIIVSDNGSPSSVALDPVLSNKAKGSVFQGGIRVPLIIGGAGVAQSLQGETVSSAVNLSDLYATILDVAEKSILDPSPATDSVSLKGILDGSVTSVRIFGYSDVFFPNFEPSVPQDTGPCRGQQAVIEDPALHPLKTDIYKYIRDMGGPEGLYDISVDPWEETNLLFTTMTQDQMDRLAALEFFIDNTLGSDLDSICVNNGKTGDSCMSGADCCSGFCPTATKECACPLP